jgi:hypothetical protein|nr:MAG TPA: Receptor Binding Protein [Caudoviricetes sp.]
MSYTYGFFDAVDLGSGNYDRVYSSAEFSHYWALLVGDGVFGQPSTSLNVLATTPVAMSVKVSPGTGWIKGHYLTVPDNMDEVIAVPVANPSLPRIDSIIMALDNTDRMMKLYVRSGTAAASPQPVSLQRDADIWELELAQVTVAAGAGNITQQAIKDMRTDPDRCGIVTGLIEQFDILGFLTAAQASFDEWFEDVQSQLGDDVAGNLLNLIQGVSNDLSDFKTEVGEDFQGVNQSISQVNTKLKDLGKVKNTSGDLRLYTPIMKFIVASSPPSYNSDYVPLGTYPLFSPDCTRAIFNLAGSKLYYFDLVNRSYGSLNSSYQPLYCDEDIFIVQASSSQILVYEWKPSGAPTQVKSFSTFSGENFILPSSSTFKQSGDWAFIGRISNSYSSANSFWIYKYNKTTKDLSICYGTTLSSGHYYPSYCLAQNGNDFFLSVSIGSNNVSPISRSGKLVHVSSSGEATQMDTFSGQDAQGVTSMIVLGNYLYTYNRTGPSTYGLKKYSITTHSKVSETTVSWNSLNLTVIGGTLVGAYQIGQQYRIDPNNLSTSALDSYSAAVNMSLSSNGFSSSGLTRVIPIPLRDQVWVGLSQNNGIFIFGPCIEFGGVPAL